MHRWSWQLSYFQNLFRKQHIISYFSVIILVQYDVQVLSELWITT